MCSASRSSRLLSPWHGQLAHAFCCAAALFFFGTTARAEPTTQPLVLRIAADPNNLPFTNDKLQGLENKIAQLIADDLGATVEYTWWAQRRGFFREALKHGDAEIVMGVPTEFEKGTIPTTPYYRSSYVFVTRKDRNLSIHSFDDAALRKVKIGVPLVGGASNAPPAEALARRGIVDNVIGFSVYSDYTKPNPPARIIEAVVNGDIDVAIVWGPLAGYFAKRQAYELEVTPVSPQFEPPSTPMAFDIGIGVKRSNKALRDQINAALARHKNEIDKILDEYNVPRVAAPPTAQKPEDPAR
jgi:mxaJ protein